MCRFVFIFALVGALAIVAACGGDDDSATECAGSATCAPVAAPCGTDTPAPGLTNAPAITFGASSQALRVEIANQAAERTTGLMNRSCLGDDWGMLFVYPEDTQSWFWMHNTLIPLSIAFVTADGTVLEIEDMAPNTDDTHSAPAPYRYAIEVNQGWFTEHGIEAGDRATMPPNLSAS